MSLVVDTHAWLWWITDQPLLSVTARARLEEASEVFIPAISLWEVAMLVEKGRLRLDRPLLQFLRDGLAWQGVELVAITPEIAARSSRLGAAVHGDPADRLIAATSIELSIPLLTSDGRLRAIPALQTVW